MLRKLFITALLALSLTALSANAALVTSISNLNIGGTNYDVTFHGASTFNDIFNKNGNGVFGEGNGSLLNRAPTFWGSENDAKTAANAIAGFLGIQDSTSDIGGIMRDGFAVPFQFEASSGRVTNFREFIVALDTDLVSSANRPGDEIRAAEPWVSFELTAISNPIPNASSLALAGLAMFVMGSLGVSRRRQIKS